jgi:hypothetical protein
VEEPEKKESVPCPKCKGVKDEALGICPACNGSGKLLLKKIGKRKHSAEPAHDWKQELKRRGLWQAN